MVAVEYPSNQNPAEIPSASFSVPVDLEHGGIRMAGCGIAFFGFAVSLIGYTLLMPEGTLLVILFSMLTAAGLAYIADKSLKGRWLSGRMLDADAEFIRLKKHDKNEIEINASKHASILRWSFKVKRNGRVKKGWHVVACALEQDGIVLPMYTFMSPDNFEKLPDNDAFTSLQPRETDNDDSTRTGRKMRLAGQQRRLHEAEQVRYMLGAELTQEQFLAYLDHLQKHHSTWLSNA